MPNNYVIAIGGSAGGLPAFRDLVAALPGNIQAPICVAFHIGAHQSILPQLLRQSGRTALHPENGARLEPGVIYVAPPDHHMIVEDGIVALHRGAKENHARPAIDPLFRSVALARREHAIGVVLSGLLDDGSAGLRAIKECGGIACVQDPRTAAAPDMPANALAATQVDYCLPIAGLARELARIVAMPPAGALAAQVPPAFALEDDAHRGPGIVESLSRIGAPSTFTCPDCGGALWELQDKSPLRFRCHTGHAFTARSLRDSQAAATDAALWSAVRALHEREMLLRRMAMVTGATGDGPSARAGIAEANRIAAQVRLLSELSQTIDTPDSQSA